MVRYLYLCLSTFQPPGQSCTETATRQDRTVFDNNTNLADSELVCGLTTVVNRQSDHLASNGQSSNTNKEHPLHHKLTLMACLVSGNIMKTETFLKTQPLSSWPHGEIPQRNNMQRTYASGFDSVVKGRLIHFRVL